MGTMWRREKNKKHSIVKKKSMNNVTLLLITCTKFYHVKEDYFHHHVFNLTEPTFFNSGTYIYNSNLTEAIPQFLEE